MNVTRLIDDFPTLPARFDETYRVKVQQVLRDHAAAISETDIIPKREISGTTHTFSQGDQNYVVTFTSSSATAATVPKDVNAAFAIGSVIHFCQYGSGQVTVAGDTGVTVRTRLTLKTAGQYAMCSIWKKGVNEWIMFGDMAAT